MRIVSITAAVAVVAFAGYSGAWYMQGKANLRAMEDKLTNIADNPYIESFSYESLDLKGYPFSIKVDVAKPKFKVKLAALIQNFNPSPLANPKASEGTVEIFSSESMQLKTNVFGSYYKLSSIGDLMIVAQNKDKAIHLKQTHDDNIVKFKMHFWDALTKGRNLEKVMELSPQDAMQLIKSIQMKSSNVILSDALTDKSILTADLVDYSIYNKSADEGYLDVGIDYDVDNYKTSDDYNQSMNEFIKALDISDSKINLQAQSEMSTSGSFHYTGPINQQAFLSMAAPIDVHFDMDYDSNLYQFNTDSQFKVNFDDSAFEKGVLKSKGDLHFKPGSHESLVEVYASIIEDLPMSNLDSEQKSLKEFVQKNLGSLVPKLEDLGLIKMDMDMNVHSDGPLMKMVIDKLSTSNDLYGVSVTGQLKANPLIPIPAGNITMTMNNMDAFFDRSQNYVDLILKYHEEQNKAKPPMLDKNTVKKVKLFVRELATEDKGDKVVWELNFTQTEPFIQVGDKKASDIQELFVSIFLTEDDEEAQEAQEAQEPAQEAAVDEVSSDEGTEVKPAESMEENVEQGAQDSSDVNEDIPAVEETEEE